MLLLSKDGIMCDYCGKIVKDHFVYYSIEGTKINVNVAKKSTFPSGKVLDYDICEQCYDNILDRVRNALSKFSNPDTELGCHLTGEKFSGNCTYTQLLFSKVEVNRADPNGPKIQRKYMDLKIGNNALAELQNKAEKNAAILMEKGNG